MKHIFAIVVLVATSWPLVGQAHSVVKSSQPADGAVLTAPPANLSLVFSDQIRLTSVAVEGQIVELPKQAGFETEFSLQLPVLTKGTHKVEWRGLSDDGHVMKGVVTFSVE